MLSCKQCDLVPVQGGRGYGIVGLVEVEGRAVWGGQNGLYVLDEANDSLANDVKVGASIAICGEELVYVCSKEVMVWREGRWTFMSNMLEECYGSCALSIGGGGLVVMGGKQRGLKEIHSLRNEVQLFDGRTWHFGPGTSDHHFLSHVTACQLRSMETRSSQWEVWAWSGQCGLSTLLTW